MIEPKEPRDPIGDGWKANLVKDFILANPGATIKVISRATRTAERTVSRVRAHLIATGQIAPAPTGRPPDPSIGEPVDDEAIRRDIEQKIASGTARVLTRDERRLRLSEFANHPKVPTQARIAALKELEATEPPAEQKLGPGVPLTTEERTVRASRVVECLHDIDGIAAVAQALHRAGINADTIHIALNDLEIESHGAAEEAVQDSKGDIAPDPV